MAKTVVIYKSKYGSTQKYARWLSDALKADLFTAKDFDQKKLSEYDTVIFGGGLYASSINGISLITKNIKNLKGKKIIVFAVGSGANDEQVRETVIKRNFDSYRNEINFYIYRGGFNFKKLNLSDKLMMLGFKQFIKKQKENQTIQELLDAYERPADWSRREYINPLLKSLK